MNELLEIKEKTIETMIYEVRGKQVMLDSDLARLYQVKTKALNQVVKRNTNRFPLEFCFQLTQDEWKDLRSQIVTLKNSRGEHTKYIPYVFTEYGITMLAGVLKSDIAVTINIQIIKTFVKLRKYISNNLVEQKYINNQVIKNTEDIRILQESFEKMNSKQKNNQLFFEGQIYDSYSLLLDIINKTKTDIIIIDNYIDKTLLDILSKTEKSILIVTNKYNNIDYEKYKEQYQNIQLKIDNCFHDRFIIIDKKEYYHCGASFKDLGKKCFAITKMDDNDYLEMLLNKI